MQTTETTTGHMLTVDAGRGLLRITGSTETMDRISDAELRAAALAAGCLWMGEVLDETTYRVTPLVWRTSPVAGATHRVSDGDVGYWVVAPGLTEAQVREAFVAGYEGDPSGAEVYAL